ncbi:hypothetical protein M2157_009647 [Streptomyces sp. SAI-127]|nr:hypothetical protein [Streptomyces sp. SAI-127]
MRLSQLARRPRHHVGAVPEPGRQSPGILDRKPHSITPGAASPTPAGRTVTRWPPTTSRRPVFPRGRSMVVAALHVVEAESHGGCAPSVRGGRTSRPVRGRRRGFRGWSASARPPTRGSKLSAFLRTPSPEQTTPPHVWFPFGGNRRVPRSWKSASSRTARCPPTSAPMASAVSWPRRPSNRRGRPAAVRRLQRRCPGTRQRPHRRRPDRAVLSGLRRHRRLQQRPERPGGRGRLHPRWPLPADPDRVRGNLRSLSRWSLTPTTLRTGLASLTGGDMGAALLVEASPQPGIIAHTIMANSVGWPAATLFKPTTARWPAGAALRLREGPRLLPRHRHPRRTVAEGTTHRPERIRPRLSPPAVRPVRPHLPRTPRHPARRGRAHLPPHRQHGRSHPPPPTRPRR